MARPSAHGHATTSTATAALQAAPADRPVPSQKPSVADRQGDHARDEHGGDPVGQPLRAGLGALRLADQAGDLGEQRVSPDPGGAHHQAPADVHGAPVTSSPGPTSDGIDSPVTIEASTAELP